MMPRFTIYHSQSYVAWRATYPGASAGEFTFISASSTGADNGREDILLEACTYDRYHIQRHVF